LYLLPKEEDLFSNQVKFTADLMAAGITVRLVLNCSITLKANGGKQ
jgi:hypothetical protein